MATKVIAAWSPDWQFISLSFISNVSSSSPIVSPTSACCALVDRCVKVLPDFFFFFACDFFFHAVITFLNKTLLFLPPFFTVLIFLPGPFFWWLFRLRGLFRLENHSNQMPSIAKSWCTWLKGRVQNLFHRSQKYSLIFHEIFDEKFKPFRSVWPDFQCFFA